MTAEAELELRAERFSALANRFCALCDGEFPSDEREREEALVSLLAQLCAEAVLLPDVEPSDRPDLEGRDPPGAVRLFGDRDHYRECFDPYDLEGEPVIGSLSDDLGDTYAGLRAGLAILERGTPDDARDAIWIWRFGFRSHWGEHVTGALRALYWRLRG